MKHLLLAVFAACSMTAAADDYNYLEVVKSDGTTTDIALNTVRKITFVGGAMVVETLDEKSQEVELEALSRLYFSGIANPVANVRADADQDIAAIYTLDGRRMYGTRLETLQGGVYIVRKSDGATIKVTRP